MRKLVAPCGQPRDTHCEVALKLVRETGRGRAVRAVCPDFVSETGRNQESRIRFGNFLSHGQKCCRLPARRLQGPGGWGEMGCGRVGGRVESKGRQTERLLRGTGLDARVKSTVEGDSGFLS